MKCDTSQQRLGAALEQLNHGGKMFALTSRLLKTVVRIMSKRTKVLSLCSQTSGNNRPPYITLINYGVPFR